MTTLLRATVFATLAVVAIAGQALAAEPWHIKCFDTLGQTLAVKALSAEGETFDVKAIGAEISDLLDVKALHPGTGEPLPVKVVASQDPGAAYSDVKAIHSGSQVIAITGITAAGKILDVKAFLDDATGRYDIKCLGSDGKKLGLKAISPAGRVFDVKGLKDLPGQEELQIEIHAHIKAMPQR